MSHLVPHSAVSRSLGWRKSSRSDANGGVCVEVAALDTAVAVRDSKDPDGPMLIFTAGDWHRFARAVKTGRHDRI